MSEREKTNLENIIADIVGKSQTDKAEAAGIMAVVSSYFRQLITGQWSDNKEYQTDDFLQMRQHKQDAYNTLTGFLWGLNAAGAIADDERDAMQDDLINIDATAYADATGGRAAGEAIADCAPETVSCEDCPHDCAAVEESGAAE